MYTHLSGPMVYTLFPCFPRKIVYTIAFLLCDLGVGRQTEKGGVPQWWCFLFFSLGFVFDLKPSKIMETQADNPTKGCSFTLRQALECTKPWFKRYLNEAHP